MIEIENGNFFFFFFFFFFFNAANEIKVDIFRDEFLQDI